MKAKIKPHGDEVTDFCDENIPKVDSNHTRLVVISLNSSLKKNENYYAQVFLKECNYTEEKAARYINDNLSDFSFSGESDVEWIKVGSVFLYIICIEAFLLSKTSKILWKLDEMALNNLLEFSS